MNMKYISLLGLMILFSLSIVGQEKNTSLKVISYNIWNGFDWGKDLTRKDKVITWIKAQKADVVALQELCGYTKEKLSEDAKAWGHPYAEILKIDGYPVGITSSKPIEIKERILDNLHHGALHCQTWDIDFIVVHFSPFSYKKRHEEADIILSKLSGIRKQQDRYVVLGDFNAVSAFDADYYKGKDNMMEAFRKSEKQHDHVRNLLNDELEYGAVSAYLSFPLIDVVQKYTNNLEQRISCPTQVFEEEVGKGRPVTSQRIDYIMVSPALANDCMDAIVANKKETYYLSDHYPVLAEFSLK